MDTDCDSLEQEMSGKTPLIRFSNPILSGHHADPSICRKGDDFYLVASSFNFFPGIPVFRSRDLINWTQIGHVLTRPDQFGSMSSETHNYGIWASTIRCYNGRFYVATHNRGGPGPGRGWLYYVYADDPTGEWSEPIVVEQKSPYKIDPNIFFDKDGRTYFTASNNIMYEIDIETGKVLKGPEQIWTGMPHLKHDEGPHIYFRDGWYYNLQGEGGMTNPNHAVTIARSRNVWGPYEGCPHNPILTHAELPHNYEIQNVGHADMVQDKGGSWWMVFLGIRPPEDDTINPIRTILGRETFLAPVTWSDDGWPVVNNNQPITLSMTAPLPEPEPVPDMPVRDDFNSETLAFQWNYYRLPVEKNYSLRDRPGFLRLLGDEKNLQAPVGGHTFVGRRLQHRRFSASTELEFDPRIDEEEAGLAVFKSPELHCMVALKRVNGVRKLIAMNTDDILSVVVMEDGPVILEIRCDEHVFQLGWQDRGTFCPLCEVDTTPFSYDFCSGIYVGMYATGNGTPATTASYFDWFDYNPVLHQRTSF